MVTEHSWNDLAAEAFSCSERNEHGKAEQAASAAISLCEQTLGPTNKQLACLLCQLSKIEQARQRYTEAESLLKRAISICERICGSDHPEVALILYKLSRLYNGQKRYGEAEWLLRRVLSCLEQSLGKNHNHLAIVLNNLAGVCYKLGKRDEAKLYYRRALDIIKAPVDTKAPEFASAFTNVGELQRSLNHYYETESIFSQAFASIEDGTVATTNTELPPRPNDLPETADLPKHPVESNPIYQRVTEILDASPGLAPQDSRALLDNFALLWGVDW